MILEGEIKNAKMSSFSSDFKTLIKHAILTYSGADPGEVKWVNFHPPFSEPLFNHADAQTSNTSTRLWFYYIITKIHPPFQSPGSVPDTVFSTLLNHYWFCCNFQELRHGFVGMVGK